MQKVKKKYYFASFLGSNGATMPLVSIRTKLYIVYTIIIVGIFIASLLFMAKTIERRTEKRAYIQLSLLSDNIENLLEPYILLNDTLPDGEGIAFLSPSVYQQEKSSGKEVIKYDTIPKEIINEINKLLDYKASNYYFYICDKEEDIVFKSQNIMSDTIPILLPRKTYATKSSDSIDSKYKNACDSKYFHNEHLHGNAGEDYLQSDRLFRNNEVLYYFKRGSNLIITIVAPIDYFSFSIKEATKVFWSYSIGILILILITCFYLVRFALAPINKIIEGANKITIHNMHDRLPRLKAQDEFSRLTTTLNAMLRRLEISFGESKRFTSDVSHELKTPLTILRGELEISLHADKTEQDYLMTIASSLDEVIRMQDVVESLLELTRADLGRMKLNLKDRSMTRLMSDIVEDGIVLAEDKGISLYSNIEPDVSFIFDPVRMHQALINIVENAIKYNKPDGKINVGFWTSDGIAHIRVGDTGIGIAKDKVDKVFDRFFRVDESRTKQGVGLGLSIVHWIVDAHMGEITVDSDYGVGTVFEITIPMNHEDLSVQFDIEKGKKERSERQRNRKHSIVKSDYDEELDDIHNKGEKHNEK